MKRTSWKKVCKHDKWNTERELQKALAIEVVKDFCRQKNYSVEGLSKELFYLFYNKCMFVHESDIVSNGVPNYIETQPKAFLSIILVNQKLEIKDDEIPLDREIYFKNKIRRTGKEKIDYEVNKWNTERELQKALAIEVVKDFCRQKNYSIEKLSKELFYLIDNNCIFAHKSDVVPNGLLNDMETQPKVILSITYVNQRLEIKDTEYAKNYITK